MRCLILIIALLLTGCATTPTSVDTLDGLTVQKGVVSIPYSRNNGGLFIVNVELLGTQANFLLDTGATRSSIFADFYEKYSMGAKDEGMVNVHGLVNSGTRPLTEIPELKLGALGFEKLVVAILPERIDVSYGPESVKLSGLLGMDIFKNYSLYIEPDTSLIHFIPNNLPRPPLSGKWDQVSLFPNPFSEQDRDLHFFDLRVGNILFPAILDSGAEFSLMNWHVTQIPQIRRLKKRLRKEWEMQGALDKFDPAVKIKVYDMRAGAKFWDKNEFIVMDFDHLEVLGIKDKPIIIAGAQIFEDKRVFMDFEENKIWFESQPRKPRNGFGVTLQTPALPSVPIAPEAHN